MTVAPVILSANGAPTTIYDDVPLAAKAFGRWDCGLFSLASPWAGYAGASMLAQLQSI